MVVLVEVQPLISGSRTTIRACSTQDRRFTGLGDERWWPAIPFEGMPTLGIRLFEGDFTSDVDPGGATLSLLMNRLEKLNANIDGANWAGAPITIYHGTDPAAWPWDELFNGKVEQFEIAEEKIKLTAKVDQSPFEIDALTATYAGTTGAEGPADLKGRVKPWVFGVAKNVEPVLIDPTDNVYQFSAYGEIEAVDTLYERGSAFAASVGDYADYAALVAASIPEGRFGTCLAEGMVRLGAPAYGVITGDVQGDIGGAADGRIDKTGGSAAWDSQAYSEESLSVGARLYFEYNAPASSNSMFIGLNSDPQSSANFTSIDCGVLFTPTTIRFREDGVDDGGYSATTGDKFYYEIGASDVTLHDASDDSLLYTYVGRGGAGLYVDSSFYEPGAYIGGIQITNGSGNNLPCTLTATGNAVVTRQPPYLRNYTGEIIERICDEAGISSGLIDSTSLAALDTAVPYPINLVLTNQETVLSIARRLCRPCNAQAGVSWNQKLFAVRVAIGTAVKTLNAQGEQLPGVVSNVEGDTSPPYKRIEMTAEQCWRVHSLDEIASQYNLIDRGLYNASTVYREGNIVNLDDGSRWLYVNATPSSGNSPAEDSYWDQMSSATNGADAATLAAIAAAQAAADDAQADADAAQADADSGLALLADIAADGKLVAGDKVIAKREYNDLIAEQTGIDAEATAYSITTEKTAYDNAITALKTYLNGLGLVNGSYVWTDTTGTTDVTRTTWDSTWSAVYSTRQTLLNAIYAAAKSLADTAQSAADAAQTAADAAQADADAAQADADAALADLADYADDDKLVAYEKQATKREYDDLIAEQTGIDAQATAYSITTEKTTYDDAVTALKTYLKDTVGVLNGSYVWTGLTGTTDITGTTWNSTWSAVYAARQALLNKIAETAGTIAEWANIADTPGSSSPNLLPSRYWGFTEDDFPEFSYTRAEQNATATKNNYLTALDCFEIITTSTNPISFIFFGSSATDYNFPLEGGKKYLLFADCSIAGSSTNQRWQMFVEDENGAREYSSAYTSDGPQVYELDLTGESNTYMYIFGLRMVTDNPMAADQIMELHAFGAHEKTGALDTVPTPDLADYLRRIIMATVEANADETKAKQVTIGGPTTIKVTRDYTGVPKTSQFTISKQFSLTQGETDVSASASWAVTSHTGFTRSIDSDGTLSITAISSAAAEATMTVTATYDGVDYPYQVAIVFVDDAPPTSGGGDVDTASLSSPTTTTYATISSKVMEVDVTDGDADITAVLSWDFYGAYSVYLKAQYSADGSTGWTDVGSEVLGSDGTPGAAYEPGDKGQTFLSVQKTGLSSGAAFFRIQGKRENGSGALALSDNGASVTA